MKTKGVSRFLSLVLRHKPEVINLNLDQNGWADVDELLEKMKTGGKEITFEELKEIVETNDKQRFKLDIEQNRIRANQGHSVSVDLALEEQIPPEILYHGTATSNLEVIRKEGLKKMSRQHVHLSIDKETATKVGSRHGKPVILKINCGQMVKDGFRFYLSENMVWLTDEVDRKYIIFE
ncbi:MAG: RNA 2'-phosphotransferase [Bacteroidia bacterium]